MRGKGRVRPLRKLQSHKPPSPATERHTVETFFTLRRGTRLLYVSRRGAWAGRWQAKDASQDLRCCFGPSKSWFGWLRPKINPALSDSKKPSPPSRLDTATATYTLVPPNPRLHCNALLSPIRALHIRLSRSPLCSLPPDENAALRLPSQQHPCRTPNQTHPDPTQHLVRSSRQDVADELSILR